MNNLHNLQREKGAVFAPDGEVPISFGNDREAFQAGLEGVAVVDRSHWGLIKVEDRDRVQFLHNQTTNDLKNLQSGQSCETVFVTSTARMIDLGTICATDEALLVLVSPGQTQRILDWFDRYLFPMDKVKLTNLSPENNIFTILGPESKALLTQLNLETLTEANPGDHFLVKIENISVRVIVNSGLTIPGYTFIIPQGEAPTIWSNLINKGGVPMGTKVWEQLRILQGRPMPGQEMTEDYNPLEAGLWDAISFTKGCYIGQETIARLNTYKGVKQRLWGVKLPDIIETGIDIFGEEGKIGTLTSVTDTPEGVFGLGYVKTKAGGAGLKVKIGEIEGELVAVPFLSHNYYEPQKD